MDLHKVRGQYYSGEQNIRFQITFFEEPTGYESYDILDSESVSRTQVHEFYSL